MYKLGEKPQRRHKLFASFVIVLALLIMGGVWASKQFLKAETTLSTSTGVTRRVDVITEPTKRVDNSIFLIKIPKNWKKTSSKLIPEPDYSFRGTSKDDAPRSLDIYVDDIPGDMAINRLLPVTARSNRMEVGQEVSENCTEFTGKIKVGETTGQVPAKWSGINFQCDVGNYLRDVVGTGSKNGSNAVTLDGAAAGPHRFFFVYTDNTSQPDYEIFVKMLESFRVH